MGGAASEYQSSDGYAGSDHVGPSLSIHPPIRRTALDVCQTRSTVREEGGGFSQVGASRPEVEEGVPA